MSKVTEKEIFEHIRAKLSPTKLTETTVALTNIALSTPEGYQQVVDYLEINPMTDNITRPYVLTAKTLKKVYSGANVAVIPFILKHAAAHGIVTKKQMCSFLATCIIESNGFNARRENMNYKPEQLVKTFSRKLIPNLEFAKKLRAQGQVATANHLYNGRMGNRPGTNDGWDYRGNSWIQLTGRSNHYEMQNITGIKVGDNPKLLEQLETACLVTMKWWKLNGLNEKSELINLYKDGYTLNTLNSRGVETKDYKMNTGARLVRRTVNGGYNGYEEFCQYLEGCLKHM